MYLWVENDFSSAYTLFDWEGFVEVGYVQMTSSGKWSVYSYSVPVFLEQSEDLWEAMSILERYIGISEDKVTRPK